MRISILLLLLVYSISAAGLTISEIQFKGNELVSDKELSDAVISFKGMDFNQETVLEDAKRISDYYMKLGFWNAKVFTPEVIPVKDEQVLVIFSIEEGGETLVNRIVFSGNTYLDSSFIMKNTTGFPEKLADLKEFIDDVVTLYNEQGFFFAMIFLREMVLLEDGSADVLLEIEEWKHCNFTKSLVTGNKVTKPKTVVQLARLQNRDIVTLSDMKQAEEKLKKRPYITDCRIVPIDNESLWYIIEEGSMTYLQALIGYDNDSSNDGRLLGYIDLDFDNLWGTDRSIGFYWENRQEQHSSIELRYHESGWELPLAGDIYLFREEMDSTWVEVSYTIDAYWYDLFARTGVYFEKQDIYPGTRRPEIIEHTEFYKAGMIWEHSNLENSINPRAGSISKLRYYYIWSKDEDEESGRQAVESRYFRVNPLFGNWVITSDINANIIENKKLTDFDRFYIGGSKSVRGFMEKQFSGFRTAWVSLELRYLLTKSARMSINIDSGYFKSRNNDEEFIGSLGFGIRVPTPIGQFSLDFALPWQQQEFSGFMDSLLHFGIETRL